MCRALGFIVQVIKMHGSSWLPNKYSLNECNRFASSPLMIC